MNGLITLLMTTTKVIATKVALSAGLDEKAVFEMAQILARFENAAEMLRVFAAAMEVNARVAISDGSIEGEAEEILWEQVEAVKQSDLHEILAEMDEKLSAC